MQKQRSKIMLFMIFMILGFSLNNPGITDSDSTVSSLLDLELPKSSVVWQNGGISIVDDGGLVTYNVEPGADGSVNNPWMIANYTINATGGDGISIEHTTEHFIIKNCTIMNGTNGVYLRNISAGIVSNNTIYGNSENGIFLDGQANTFFSGVNNIIVEYNIIHDNTGTVDDSGNGIFLDWKCTNNYLVNNTIYGNYGSGNFSGNGILLYSAYGIPGDCDNNHIFNNTIFDNSAGPGGRLSGNGIVLYDGCESNEIIDNIIYGNNGGDGYFNGNGILFMSNNNFNLISKNTIFGNSAETGSLSGNGLLFYSDSNNNDIIDNSIYNNLGGIGSATGNGIYATDYTYSIIENNSIYGNVAGDGTDSGNGIGFFGDCNNVDIINNEIHDNTGGSNYTGGNGIVLILNCAFITIEYNSIYGNAAGEGDWSGNGIFLWITSNNTINNNTISNNFDGDQVQFGSYPSNGNGIYMHVNCDYQTISGNTFNYNTNYGVFISSSDYNNVTSNVLFGNGQSVCIFEDHLSVGNVISSNGCTILFVVFDMYDPISYNDDWTAAVVTINWTGLFWADYYYVYRSLNSTITDGNLNELTPLAKVTDSIYSENISISGQYYYAVLPGNSTFNGTISNNLVAYVTIFEPSDPPIIPSFGIWNTILVILSAVGFIIWKTGKKKDC